jgi:hypothetical protein
MHPPSLESGAELAELRRRAYGPDADIANDPAAMARLADLEGAARHPVPAAAIEAPNDQPGDAAPAAVADHGESPVIDGLRSDAASAPRSSDPDAVTRSWWRRPSAWLIAAGAIVLTVAVSGVAMALLAPRGDLALAPVSSDDGERQRLAGQGIIEMYGMDRTTLQRYDSYRELHVWSASATNGNRCILLETDAYGVYGVNCAPRGLAPTFDLYVYPGIPTDLSGDLPIGSVARFVLDGDRVSIWIAEAEAEA